MYIRNIVCNVEGNLSLVVKDSFSDRYTKDLISFERTHVDGNRVSTTKFTRQRPYETSYILQERSNEK